MSHLKHVLMLVVLFTVAGCVTTENVSPQHEFLEINTHEVIVEAPSCVPSELPDGYKESCLEDLEGYQIYLDRYLTESYNVTGVTDVSKKVCNTPITKPVLQPRPTINADVVNQSDEELISRVVDYTDRLELYLTDTINRYNQQILKYNEDCKAVSK